MLIGDGVTPGNEGRGYVLRRCCAGPSARCGCSAYAEPVLSRAAAVDRHDGGAVPRAGRPTSSASTTVAYAEEEAFRQTLAAGTAIFDTAVDRDQARRRHVLSGDKAFQLHDTYGFPIDLTLEMAPSRA
jgi:alanyl-tRNA synthetase